MATEQEMNELLGRMITDGGFRDKLMQDPKAAVKEAGYDLTSEQLDQLETPEMGELVGAVDERVSKFVLLPGMMADKGRNTANMLGASAPKII